MENITNSQLGSQAHKNEPELNLLLPEHILHASLWESLKRNVRDNLFPEKLPPLQLTSRPVNPREIWTGDTSLLASLLKNLRDALFPEKLPPLQMTAKPVKVRDIWGEYNYKKKGALGSVMAHMGMIAALIVVSIVPSKPKAVTQPPQEVTQLVAPDPNTYLPISMKKNDVIGGGGGGGDRDKLQAPKGRLPRQAMEQFTPPAMVVRNDNPKLPMEPTIVVPPQVKLANNNMPNFGDPKAAIPSGPMSNGTGSGGGIGSGSGGGIGSGTGPGLGPGSGGGTGGGVFRVGGGVSAPRAVYTPDPEYSEEARKAKYQGTVVLWLVVDSGGRPRDVKIARSLGMGLDQKAIDAVRQWKFEPAMKDNQPVAVQINVEVNFRLY